MLVQRFVRRCVRFVGVAALALILVYLGVGTLSSAGRMPSSTAVAAGQASISPCERTAEFDAGDFSDGATIDNSWLPLIPGTQITLQGQADRGGGLLPHVVVFTVTDLTKVINGVRTVVVWDRDINDGELEEAELAFFAQDDSGHVWNLGEYPEVYEDGAFVGAPDTWIAGLNDAEAGIHMLAHPGNGTSYYLQGYAPDIDFLDCAKVFKTGERTCGPVTCYDNVLVTDEISPLENGGGHQRKFHAPGVGIVKVSAVGDPEGETLSLTSFKKLSKREAARARSAALRLERNAYRVSEVYAQTPPAE